MSLLVRPQAFTTDFDRLFNTLLGTDEARGQRWTPPMDLVEGDDHYTLRADLPGLSEEDVSIEVSEGVLQISGERRSEQEQNGRGWYRVERSFGRFSRSMSLPEGVEADQISASFDRGVLSVRIPKPPERKPTRIEIAADKQATIEGTAKES